MHRASLSCELTSRAAHRRQHATIPVNAISQRMQALGGLAVTGVTGARRHARTAGVYNDCSEIQKDLSRENPTGGKSFAWFFIEHLLQPAADCAFLAAEQKPSCGVPALLFFHLLSKAVGDEHA